MTIFNTKLTLWAGLLALVLSIAACQFTSPDKVVRACPHIRDMPERDREVFIEWNDTAGEWFVNIQQKVVDFTHKDNLRWEVKEPKNPLHSDYQSIDKFAIKFENFSGCTTNSNVPKAWPCKDNPGKWLEEVGISDDGESVANGNQKIQCNIRPGSTQKYVGSWDYCYTITAWSAGVKLDPIDPVGTGSGCYGCHSTENTF